MAVNSEVEQSRFDGIKWLVVSALVALGVVGNYFYAGESLLYRVLGLLVVAIIAALIALQTAKGKQFSGLMKEARVEIRKVVWPTRPEMTQTTLIVIVFVLFVALILWGLDSLVSWIVSIAIG
jgi:preprotein translocase subunit SecE